MPNSFLARPAVGRDSRTIEMGDWRKQQRSFSAHRALRVLGGGDTGFRDATGAMAMADVEGYRIQISKVILDNLPLSYRSGGVAKSFKATFRAGTAVVETPAKRPNAHGDIEWPELLEMCTNVGDETIIATVVSRDTHTDPWTLVTGCRFKHSGAAHPTGWQHRSDPLGTGPNLRAYLETFAQRYRNREGSFSPPRFGTEAYKRAMCFPPATGSTNGGNVPTASAVGVKSVAGLGAGSAARAQEGHTRHTRSVSLSSYFMQRLSLLMKDGGRSVESPDSSLAMNPLTDEDVACKIRQGAVPLESTMPPTCEVESSACAQQDKFSSRLSRELDGDYPTILLRSLTENSSSTSHISRAPSYSIGEIRQGPMDGGSGIPRKEGPTTVPKDVSTAGGRRYVSLLDRVREFAIPKPAAASNQLAYRRGTEPLSPPPLPVDKDIVRLAETRAQPRSVDIPLPSVVGKGVCSPSRSLPSLPHWSETAKNEPPPPPHYDEQVSLGRHVTAGSALGRAHAEEESALERDSHLGDHPDLDDTESTHGDGDDAVLDTGLKTTRLTESTDNAVCARDTLSNRRTGTGEYLDRHVAPPALSLSSSTAGTRSLPATSGVPAFGRLQTRDGVDPVYCVSITPPLVCAGCHFQLKVSACSGQATGEVLGAGSGNSETEMRLPEEMPIEHSNSLNVKLEAPTHVFKVLDPTMDSSSGDTRKPADQKVHHGINVYLNIVGLENHRMKLTNIDDSNKAPHQPPSGQDLGWNGNVQYATFSVQCLPGAPVGLARCGACFTEGSIVTRLSFRIEVAETGPSGGRDDTATAVVKELDITVDDEIRTAAAVVGRSLPATPEDVPGKRIRACPPPPFLLASRVGPGAAVRESKEHGFRLTVPDGSLNGAIGPITVQQFARVVKCEDDGKDYLVKAVVDCQPSGSKFPEAPILLDFAVGDGSLGKSLEPCQVLVLKNEAEGWRKVESELRADEWGTYMRAAVSDFCWFACGTNNHPGDPVRLEDSAKDGMIEVQNATDAELFAVLVPVSFDSDITSRVTYTGTIGFGAAGVTVEAGGSSSHERVVKSHILPAGFTPDDVSIAPGGTFPFNPPAQSGEGKLLVATISEEAQAGVTVKLVVLHGKFGTPAGKRTVILPVFLQGKSQIGARLGPDDVPVEMVMIMAGLGSKTTSPTVALSPEYSLRLAASAPGASGSAPPAAVQTGPPHSTRSRRDSMKKCVIS